MLSSFLISAKLQINKTRIGPIRLIIHDVNIHHQYIYGGAKKSGPTKLRVGNTVSRIHLLSKYHSIYKIFLFAYLQQIHLHIHTTYLHLVIIPILQEQTTFLLNFPYQLNFENFLTIQLYIFIPIIIISNKKLFLSTKKKCTELTRQIYDLP